MINKTFLLEFFVIISGLICNTDIRYRGHWETLFFDNKKQKQLEDNI